MEKLAPFRDPLLWFVGLAALVILGVAFQTPYTYLIDIGSPSDRAFVIDGLHGREIEDSRSFRWTSERGRVVFPALTAGEWRLTLTLNGWQAEATPKLGIKAGGLEISFKTQAEWESVRRAIKAPAGDLVIDFETSIFRPSNYGNADSRALGVRLDALRLTPWDDAPRLPPLTDYVVPLAVSVMLIYFAGRRVTEKPLYALSASGLLLACLSLLIVSQRVFLNQHLVRSIWFSSAVGALMMWVGVPVLRRLYDQVGIAINLGPARILALIVSILFALKMIGVFYPQLFIFDALFHLHRLELVQTGQLFFVTSSREFASLQTVYPPGMYVLLSPLGWLVPDELALVKLMPVVLEAIGGLVLFWIALKNGLGEIAALLATFLYLASPLAFIMFGWGIYTNVFAMQLTVLTVAAWYALPWREHRASSIGVFALISFVALLSHASMLPMLITFWGIALMLHWVLEREARARVVQISIALAFALLIATALYFSVYVDKTLSDLAALGPRDSAQPNEFARVLGGGLDDPGLGLVPVRVTEAARWLPEALAFLARESWAYFRVIPLLLAGIGCVGLARRHATRGLALLIAAGLGIVLIFFAVGAIANLYTRYMLFGAPFIALSAGYVLERVWQGGRVARSVVLISCALLLHQSLWYWAARVLQ